MILDIFKYAAPVVFAAGGETVGQRSGVINISIEGSMLVGAFAAMSVSRTSGSPYLGILAGLAVGAALAVIFAVLCVLQGRDQVVVGTALNLLALGATKGLFRTQFGQSGQLLTVPRLPAVVAGWDLVLLLMVPLIGLIAWVLVRTNLGLALRAAGEYPEAVAASGFSPLRIRFGATVFSGMMAGLGGGYLALGIVGTFTESIVSGRGFVAIAMVTFGRWKPWWVLAACLLIGWVDGLQYSFQSQGVNLPSQLMVAMPYLVALAVLVIVGKGSRTPAALAQPYQKEA